MTVVGVFAETDVACDVERWKEFAQLFDRRNDGTGWVICRGASGILKTELSIEIGSRRWYLDTIHRDAEQDDTLEAFLDERSDEVFQLIDAPPALVWKGGYYLACIWIISDEDGIHEHGFRELPLGLP